MKKTLAILMAIILIFSFAACKSDDGLSSSDIPVSDDFQAPENYAVVLLASINPQIKLYLDKYDIVLAIEAVNDDAKQIIDEIEYKNTDYKQVIKSFVSVANSKGFIKGDAKIDFEILENKESSPNAIDILNQAAAAAESAANEAKITLNTNIIDTISKDDSATGPDSQIEDTSKPEGTSSDKTPESTHKHSFSAATCTEAAKCSCGESQGKALGHKWQNATCKAAKTCKVCGVTEGNKGDHTYSNGVCTVCGLSSALNPKKDLKTHVEYLGNFKVSGDMLIGGALQFEDDACVVTERYFNSVQNDPSQTPIVFEGKKYYSEGGGQTPHNFELTDTEVIIKGSFWGDSPDGITIKLTLQGNGMLKVTSSSNPLFPVGAVFSTNINDVLK